MPTIAGRVCPPSATCPLAESTPAGMAADLAENGYALLREAHDPNAVLAARAEVLSRLAEVGEVDATTAIATGRSDRAALHPDLGRFWRSVSEGPALRRVIHGTRITELMSDLLGTPAAHFSFAWLRAMAAGRASPLHVDHPYMNRGSNRLLTVWTPLGDVGLDEGPLYLLEGSHRWPDLRAQFQGRDVDRDDHPPGHITDHPLDLASRHGARLLTTEFAPGDVLVFGMFTAHAAFDNTSATGRVRISCDTRFQPAADPMDDRWSGDNPPAHGGLGYGCLAASRPLTADLPRR